jgi:hypothetical protein
MKTKTSQEVFRVNGYKRLEMVVAWPQEIVGVFTVLFLSEAVS